MQHPATYCNLLQLTATHCNSLPARIMRSCLRHTATHCNPLQHTATHATAHWNNLWLTELVVTHCCTLVARTIRNCSQHTATLCNTLRLTTTAHCNTLQFTATNCDSPQHIHSQDNEELLTALQANRYKFSKVISAVILYSTFSTKLTF